MISFVASTVNPRRNDGRHCKRPWLSQLVFDHFFVFVIGGNSMLRWAILFLVIAIIAAIFGFGGVVAVATDAAKILFFVFLVLFVVALILGRRPPSMG
jgi:uncharacterized membrane protein YtjA (UPF0391 family)